MITDTIYNEVTARERQKPSERELFRMCRFYLIKWAKLHQNIERLTRLQEVQLKILYSALSEISEEDREFLKEKYLVTVINKRGYLASRTDPDMAKEMKLSLKAYRSRKAIAERNLAPHIQSYIGKHKEELTKAIEAM